MRLDLPELVEIDVYPREEAIRWGYGFDSDRPDAVAMLRLDDTHGSAQTWLSKDEIRELIKELEKFL